MLLDTQWTKVAGTAAGTTVVSDRNCYLDKIIFPASATGTVSFYDCSTGAGTAAGNLIMAALDQNKVGTAAGMPYIFEMNTRLLSGLTAVYAGTVNFTVIWG